MIDKEFNSKQIIDQLKIFKIEDLECIFVALNYSILIKKKKN